MSNKMKRITDLFSTGEVVNFGNDELGAPVLAWVQKNTSIEEDEARMDGQAGRTRYLMGMADINNPEVQNVYMTLEEWTDDELYAAASNQNYEKALSDVLAELEGEEDWAEKLNYLRKEDELLNDADAPEDDPKRVKFSEVNTEYMIELDKRCKVRMEAELAEAKAKGRKAVEDEFVKNWKDRQALEHYMTESRVTKIYFAVRDCEAVFEGDRWKHKACDHNKKLMSNRKEVRELPEDVLAKILEAFDNLVVGARNVANFPEASNSSESSA